MRVICVILRLAVLVEYRYWHVLDRVADREMTHDDCIYRTSIVSRGKNRLKSVKIMLKRQFFFATQCAIIYFGWH